jgi:hypothetical protein
LIDTLKAQHLGGAALDVLREEGRRLLTVSSGSVAEEIRSAKRESRIGAGLACESDRNASVRPGFVRVG